MKVFPSEAGGKAYNESSTLCLLEMSREMTSVFLERFRHYNCNYRGMNLKVSPVLQQGIRLKLRKVLRIQKFEIELFLTVTHFQIKL